VPPSIYPPNFPFQPHFVQVGRYRLAYFDEGVGRPTLLLLHGNPVSAYVYHRLMRLLIPHVRCVAPDLLGFGISEKPTAVTDYSLKQHIDLMAGLVQALDLQEVVLVGHDWGGPIGWGAAVSKPSRYTHLIILNTLTEAPMKIRPIYWLPFHFFRQTPRLFDYLARQHNLFQKMGTAVIEEADRQVFFRANHSPETRAGIAAFPRMIPFNRSHPNYPVLQKLLNAVAGWDIPALVLFSDHDSVFTAGQGQRFAQRLKQAQFKLVAGPRHFLQYEAPKQIAQEILAFLEVK
jgi:haloalkane dehalogenase